MCFPWLLFKKENPLRKFDSFFECSCDICGNNYETMEALIKHMGSHEFWQINAKLKNNFGTVRCNKCWGSFTSVAVMADHICSSEIRGLSPVASSESLESVLIHDTYTQSDNHNN